MKTINETEALEKQWRNDARWHGVTRSYSVEKVLQKLARQLNEFDEASLASLWERYAGQVEQFEPSKRWEEAALILSFIQAVRFKNQLFNFNWSKGLTPGQAPPPKPKPALEAVPATPQAPKPQTKVLAFTAKPDSKR